MKSFEYTIKDELGVHARPAGLLAKRAKEFESEITLTKGDRSALCSRLLSLMSLGIKQGDKVSITVVGVDEEAAAEAMKEFFENNL